MRSRLLIAAAMLLVASSCGGTRSTALPSLDGLTVLTDKGSVHGMTVAGLREFLGVPYAAPPVGALRFAAPQPHAAWTAPLDATKPGNVCPQPQTAFGPLQNTSEDCLDLNVTTPSGAANLPVMVWVHGGGFISGSGSFYDASKLVATGNIVVVTVNYRLGVLGFLAHPGLDAGNGNTGNYGIEDQQAALKWVRTNIAAFGGNPANVTLAGESAGAISICANLASPAVAGLFGRAIVESGPCANPLRTLPQAEQLGTQIATGLGCTGGAAQVSACLRSPSLTTAAIVQAQSAIAGLPFGPSVGGVDVPGQPRQSLGKLPLLLGGNRLELGLFVGYGLLPVGAPTSAAQYAADVNLFYGPAAGPVLAQYPYANYPDGYTAFSTVLTDYNVPVSALAMCEDVLTFNLQGATSAPIYAYEFNDPNAVTPQLPPGPVHAAELRYLFPNLSSSYPSNGPSVPAGSQPLADAMVRYWTNFVATGNPNGAGLPAWPAYHAPTDALQLAPTIGTGVDVSAEHKCGFWNALGLAT